MRFVMPALLAALLMLPLASSPVRADDEEGAEGLVTRIFDVSALMQGRPGFLRQWGLAMDVDAVSDEENPLFGGEEHEAFQPLGQIDELMGLIRRHVRPDSWDTTLGAVMMSNAERMLIVRSYQDVVDEVAAYLGRMERLHMRRVAVDVETYLLTPAEAQGLLQKRGGLLLDPVRFEPLRGGEKSGPSLSLTAFERHRASMFTGRQRSYLIDYDVEVAVNASTSDPIVGVVNLGLSADIEPILGPAGDAVLLTVSAAVSRQQSVRIVDTGLDRAVEMPQVDLASVRSKVEIPTGAWALLDGEADAGPDTRWMFAVRATALPVDGVAEKARTVAFDSPAGRPARKFELQSFDIGMLDLAVASFLGEEINLVPSNFTPPEPPELPEPTPVFAAEGLIELIRESIVPASWGLTGTSIEARNGYLHVRNAPEVLRILGERLRVLRQEFVYSLASTAEFVEVNAALARRLESAPGRVVDGEGARLLAAAIDGGTAQRIGIVRVTSMNGSRNAMSSGRRFAYLSDFEVEIAEGATISNPVVHTLLSGSVLDVQPVLTAGGNSVQTVVRFTRGQLTQPMRQVATPHGGIDMPEMDHFQVRAALQAPLDKTLVVASAGDGSRRRLLLLTTRLRRASK